MPPLRFVPPSISVLRRRGSAGVAVSMLTLVAMACSLTRSPARHPHASNATGEDAVPAPVELRRFAKRPPIHLVDRSGDPLPAVALAVAHEHGSEASAALAGLLEHRLRGRGLVGVEVRIHELGLEIQDVVRSPREAARWVDIVSEALRTPVTNADPGLAAARQRLAELESRTWAGRFEAGTAQCSGEAGILPSHELTDLREDATALERWRRAAYSSSAAAFGAIGPPKVLEAAAKAVAKTRPWPSQPRPRDKWPAADQIGAETALDGRRLSVALRLAEGGSAVAAARRLGSDASFLQRLATVDPDWNVTRVISTLRPRGACLRIDLEASDEADTQDDTVAGLALVALQAATRAVDEPNDGAFALHQSLLMPSDPRDVAGAAAWQALVGIHEPGPRRRFVSYVAERPAAAPDLAGRMSRLEKQWAQPSVEVRDRLEPGQAQIWALVASPCGTASEGTETAGHGAIVVRTLARQAARDDGVVIEPWVTVDGIGLLAHGPRLDPTETAEQHAVRIGAALGRALSHPVAGNEIAGTRTELQHTLGPGPRPGWWLTIEALAPERPSWLEPFGTWQSIADASTHSVSIGRMQLASGPLRLAVIANVDPDQAKAVARGLDQWLRPLRSVEARCAFPPRPASQSGRLEIETSAGPGMPSAYVGVPLPPARAGLASEAHYTLWLMNRPGGWLDRSLKSPGLVATAQARLLGGRRAGAIIVTVEANPEQTERAVAQVRALLERLAEGAASENDFRRAQLEFQRGVQQSELDPRRRVIDVWQRSRPVPPTLTSLRAFHRRALAAERHVVVVVVQEP